MLLITGTEDITVSAGNTACLAATIHAHGGRVPKKDTSGIVHAGIVVRLSAPFRGDGEILRAITDFGYDHSRASSREAALSNIVSRAPAVHWRASTS